MLKIILLFSFSMVMLISSISINSVSATIYYDNENYVWTNGAITSCDHNTLLFGTASCDTSHGVSSLRMYADSATAASADIYLDGSTNG